MRILLAGTVLVLSLIAGPAWATQEGVLSLDSAQEYVALQDDIQKAWRQRDEALAQVEEMQKLLSKKCGAEEAADKLAEAKVAAKQLTAEREAAKVKQNKEAAQDLARAANAAMKTAQAASAEQLKVEAELKQAKLDLSARSGKAQALRQKAQEDQAAAEKSSGATVKSAFSKASGEAAAATEAEESANQASSNVQKLEGEVSTAQAAAEAKLRLAKEQTENAASEVDKSMQQEADAATQKQQALVEHARLVQQEEDRLVKQAEELKKKIAAAKIKTKNALVDVEVAKASEAKALSQVKLPSKETDMEKAEYAKAKHEAEVDANPDGSQATYATTIKNIEAKLLKTQTEIDQAHKDTKQLKEKLSKTQGLALTEDDDIEKEKLEKKAQSLQGEILNAEARGKTAANALKKFQGEQEQAIRQVISNVALDAEDEQKKLEAQDEIKNTDNVSDPESNIA